jgi:hypothetical protein
MAKRTKHAYQQAPWRRQLQSLGFSLLPIVAIGVLASLHLVFSAQAAAAGLQIMDMHYEEEEILRTIANQRTQLALITSYTEMQKRAIRAGFTVPPSEHIHFMTITWYTGREAALLAPPPGMDNIRAPLANAYYQESLLDWFLETFMVDQNNLGGQQ